jgi:hypothetical protein
MSLHPTGDAHGNSAHLLGVGFTVGTATGFIVGLLGGGSVGAHFGAAMGACVGLAVDLLPTRPRRRAHMTRSGATRPHTGDPLA